MIIVTRSDLSYGLQMSQMGHSLTQFIMENYELSKKWNNNYLISLSISSEKKLEALLTKLCDMDIPVSYFTEPDIDDQLTSIAFIETEKTVRLTSSLPKSLEQKPINV
jgi:hypothetical protein